MKTGSAYWKGVHRRSKICRDHRRASQLKHMPAIRSFCAERGIEVLRVEHGYQFRMGIYVITWSPGTNKVSAQYRIPGHSWTFPYTDGGRFNKPRIMVALEELHAVTSKEHKKERDLAGGVQARG